MRLVLISLQQHQSCFLCGEQDLCTPGGMSKVFCSCEQWYRSRVIWDQLTSGRRVPEHLPFCERGTVSTIPSLSGNATTF